MKTIVKKHFKSFMIVVFLVIICNVLAVLHPFIMKKVIDIDFEMDNLKETLLTLFFAYVIIHVILAIMRDVRNFCLNKVMAKILRDIREKLFSQVLKMRMKTFNKYNSSEIYTRLTLDVENLFQLFLE